jgi:hypothetical protein
MIPRGSVFTLPVSQDPNVNTFDWTVDIAEGTRVLLTMGDEGPYGTGVCGSYHDTLLILRL